MAPRPRNGLNARLPKNLSLHATGQYRYVHPVTKQHYYFGSDRQRAIQAANKCNALLLPNNELTDKVLHAEHKVAASVDLFRNEVLPERTLKPKTENEYKIHLRRIEADLGRRTVEQLTVKDCAEYLREVTPSLRLRQRIRSLLVGVLDCAVQEGWIDHNPASATRVAKAKRKRQRLTLEGFQAIRKHAEPWLGNAMDLGLHTLLRAGDLAALRFEDIQDGYLYVIPRKTETTSYHRLKLRIDGDLGKVIERCRDGVASPYLIHRLPRGLPTRKKWAKEREHHTQLLTEQISRAFERARSRSPELRGVENPPTFHEIRSLGGDLYRQAGWTLDQVQALMGHATADMTTHYLKGHDAPWTESPAGLSLQLRK